MIPRPPAGGPAAALGKAVAVAACAAAAAALILVAAPPVPTPRSGAPLTTGIAITAMAAGLAGLLAWIAAAQLPASAARRGAPPEVVRPLLHLPVLIAANLPLALAMVVLFRDPGRYAPAPAGLLSDVARTAEFALIAFAGSSPYAALCATAIRRIETHGRPRAP